MFWHIWPFQWNTFLPIWEKCLVPSIWRVYIKKKCRNDPQGHTPSPVTGSSSDMSPTKGSSLFLALGCKVLVLRYFLTGSKLFLLSHKSLFAMRNAKCLRYGTGCMEKNSCSSTLSASYWWMVPVSRTPIATAPNSKLPHSSLSLSLSMASADPHFLVIEYFQMGPFSALRCHSCSFPSFRTG